MTLGMTLTTSSPMNGRARIAAKPIRELTPSVDVFENDDELLFLADLPGTTAESVTVSVEGGQMTIEAQRTVRGETLRYRRMFQLPRSADPEGISAELRDGTLRLHVKKSEQAKRRTIPVRSF